MRRTLTTLVSGLALSCWMGASALAADPDPDAANQHMIDAQKDINQGKRKAADDQVKAREESTGNKDLTSMNKELRDKLGDNWTVKKSGNGYLATRVAPKKAATNMSKKVTDQMRDFRDTHKDAQVMRNGDEVTLRGRIDDCGDAAKAADDFATIDGVNRVLIDLSCAPNL